MEDKKVNQDPLSARQLGVAVLVGGLSWVGAVAGRMDWRWAMATLPLGVLLGWLLLRRVGRAPLFRGPGGGVLAVGYGGWAMILLACLLRRTAERILNTGGSQAQLFWVLALLTLPLLWIGMGKAAAFFRMVEVLWLGVVVLLAALLLLMLPKVNWQYVFLPQEDWMQSVLAMVEVLSPGIFVLPYLYKVERGTGERRQALGWLGVLGGVAVGLTALVQGILSPALARQLQDPFFGAVGVLGDTARLEGLISALWLLPDLSLAGLLAQTWGRKPRPAAAAGGAFLLALTGWTGECSPQVIGGGTLVLVILTFLIPGTRGKIVVPYS